MILQFIIYAFFANIFSSTPTPLILVFDKFTFTANPSSSLLRDNVFLQRSAFGCPLMVLLRDNDVPSLASPRPSLDLEDGG